MCVRIHATPLTLLCSPSFTVFHPCFCLPCIYPPPFPTLQVRLYRVRWFFRYLEYDLTVSLLTVTVARNLVIVLYLTHWVACGFNFLARSGGYDPDMLVGLNSQLFASISPPEQYLYSLYWSITTLAGVLNTQQALSQTTSWIDESGWVCVCGVGVLSAPAGCMSDQAATCTICLQARGC